MAAIVNGLKTLGQKCKATALHATEVYQQTIEKVTPMENLILHQAQLNMILNWTKQHLDVDPATADVICEWSVEPG